MDSTNTSPPTQASNQPAWYLRVRPDQVGSVAVLVGDRGRAIASLDLLDRATIFNEDRGLTTITGTWNDTPVTVTAFGMGAPIATVCLHELAALGVNRFVRAGTMMSFGRTQLGDLIIAEQALVHEGTSLTYGGTVGTVAADKTLVDIAVKRTAGNDRAFVGAAATCDGFYTQMSNVLGNTPEMADLHTGWHAADVIGVDMETSALYTASRRLGVQTVSVCLASVDLASGDRLEIAARQPAEVDLMRIAFDIATAPNPPIERNNR